MTVAVVRRSGSWLDQNETPASPPAARQVETTTPTGHTYGSSPAVAVTIRETPIRLHLVLAS